MRCAISWMALAFSQLGCGDPGSERMTSGSASSATTAVASETAAAETVGSSESGVGDSSSASMSAADSSSSATTSATLSTTTASTTADPSTSSTSGAESSVTVSSSSGSNTSSPDPSTTGPTSTTCTKVDFLFVIDNSASMGDNQANLIANFPAFYAGIQTKLLTVSSYQVGIVSTDEYADNIPQCQVLGGLVVKTLLTSCGPYAEGYNFMTQKDVLPAEFSCAANVGILGSGDEKQLAAMQMALSDTLSAMGSCNYMYSRPDALLVIVILTDEEDGSAGDVQTYIDAVIAEKGQENKAVAVVFAQPEFQRYQEFLLGFTYKTFEDIDATNYGPAFEAAIAVIDTACNNFSAE